MSSIVRIVIRVAIVCIVVYASLRGWRISRVKGKSENSADMNLIENLKRHVYVLSQKIGERSLFTYSKLTQAQDYISEQFKSLGYEVVLDSYKVDGKLSNNIIVTKKGSLKADEIVIAGAHYDSCFNPGADDNASGVAVLLELARLLKGTQTRRTIRLIAFVNEEPPFFHTPQMGSYIYAQRARKRGDDIKAVLIFEMVGYYSDKPNSQRYPPLMGPFYPNRGNFIAVAGNFSSGELVKRVVRSFKKTSDFPIESVATFEFVPGIDFSDHWSFWRQGYPAVMITDTSFYRYPHYHSSLDTHEKLDYANMAELTKGFLGVIRELAQLQTAE